MKRTTQYLGLILTIIFFFFPCDIAILVCFGWDPRFSLFLPSSICACLCSFLFPIVSFSFSPFSDFQAHCSSFFIFYRFINTCIYTYHSKQRGPTTHQHNQIKLLQYNPPPHYLQLGKGQQNQKPNT